MAERAAISNMVVPGRSLTNLDTISFQIIPQILRNLRLLFGALNKMGLLFFEMLIGGRIHFEPLVNKCD
jgi:hypothetical protein